MDEQSRILNVARSEVSDRIDSYRREVLVRDPGTGFWLPAYETIHGLGTKVRRARSVGKAATILLVEIAAAQTYGNPMTTHVTDAATRFGVACGIETWVGR